MKCLRSVAMVAVIGGLLTQGEAAQTLRIDVDLVLVQATVVDRNNRSVNGLTPEQFRIIEDKIEQNIEYFSTENVPLSVGIVFDVSSSMQNKLAAARAAANVFLDAGEREDEYFIVQFSDAPELVQDFTTDIGTLRSKLNDLRPKGRTSLYDSLYFALETMSRSRNSRKTILLITDGEDNYSRYSMGDVKNFARERDVVIYGIGIDDHLDLDVSGVYGRAVLSSLADLSGGAAFFPRSLDALPEICAQIGLDLKNQYVIGYRSHNSSKDGKWRKIQVKLNTPKRLHVRAKSGYYAGAAIYEARRK
jgi:Ca-activated chloride channel family protein